MGANDIGDDGMSSVFDGLQHNNTLTKLSVSMCKFSVKGSHNYIWSGILRTKSKIAAIYHIHL